MSDYDIKTIVDELKKEKYYDERPWHTALLKNKETGEHFVIKNIYIDEDDDVIFEIEML